MSKEPKINKLDELEMAFAFSDGMEEDCRTYVSKRDGSIVRDDEMLSGEPCPVEDIEFNNDNLPEDLRRKLESTIGNTPGADFASINEALQAKVEQYNHTPQAELRHTMERYFVRPLHQWGLLEVQWNKDRHFPDAEQVRISPLFQQFIQFDEQAE